MSDPDYLWTINELQAELVDVRGIAEMLGLTYESARTAISKAERHKGDFPASVLTIGSSRAWLRQDIKEWDNKRRGRGGVPKHDNLLDQLYFRYCYPKKNGQTYLSPSELAEFLHMTTADMAAWRAAEYGPPYRRVKSDKAPKEIGYLIRYDLHELVEWLTVEEDHLERIRREDEAQ